MFFAVQQFCVAPSNIFKIRNERARKYKNNSIITSSFGIVSHCIALHCSQLVVVPFEDWFRYRSNDTRAFVLDCIECVRAIETFHFTLKSYSFAFMIFKCRHSDHFTACILFGRCVSILFVNLNMTSALYARCLFY